MKKVVLLVLCFFHGFAFAQNEFKRRNFFSLIPAEVDQVNGLAFGAWAANLRSYSDSIKINGFNLEINPVMLFIYIRGGVYIPKIDSFQNYLDDRNRRFDQAYINGLSISIPGFYNINSRINGVNITAFTFCAGEINGLSISGLSNCSYVMNGVSICGLYNSSNRVRGLQIGLFNRATKLRGFQIGLWNKNGKRSLPFLNWQFRD